MTTTDLQVAIAATLAISAIIFLATVVGAFVGAWLTYRASHQQSPLPSLPKKPEENPVDKDKDRDNKITFKSLNLRP